MHDRFKRLVIFRTMQTGALFMRKKRACTHVACQNANLLDYNYMMLATMEVKMRPSPTFRAKQDTCMRRRDNETDHKAIHVLPLSTFDVRARPCFVESERTPESVCLAHVRRERAKFEISEKQMKFLRVVPSSRRCFRPEQTSRSTLVLHTYGIRNMNHGVGVLTRILRFYDPDSVTIRRIRVEAPTRHVENSAICSRVAYMFVLSNTQSFTTNT